MQRRPRLGAGRRRGAGPGERGRLGSAGLRGAAGARAGAGPSADWLRPALLDASPPAAASSLALLPPEPLPRRQSRTRRITSCQPSVASHPFLPCSSPPACKARQVWPLEPPSTVCYLSPASLCFSHTTLFALCGLRAFERAVPPPGMPFP